MTSVAVSPVEGVLWGPTWKRDRSGTWILPRLTLGWEAAAWAETNLVQPDGPDAGSPWRFTDEQLRFWLWLYAIDENGRFLTPEAVLQRVKGWGKDPFGGAWMLTELLGPCRFAGFDAEGSPHAVPHPSPLVQTLAVSRDQTRNVMSLIPGFFSRKKQKELGLDIGKEIVYAAGRGRLEAVTSSSRSLEGARGTAVLANETQHWVSANNGHQMNAVVKRNLVKSRDGQARYLKITNAPMPGEDSVGEQDWLAFQEHIAGKLRRYSVLYDSLEAPADTDLLDEDSARRGLMVARGDSTWLDPDRHIAAMWDSTIPVQQSRRFYFNQVVAPEDAWCSPQAWDACTDTLKQVEQGEQITAFFDGSKNDDSTGIVGCRVSDGHLFVIDVWECPEGPASKNWEVPRGEVDAAVYRMFDRYQVAAFYCDVAGWESYIDKWRDDLGRDVSVMAVTGSGKTAHAFAWDMRSHVNDFTAAAERFVAEAESYELTHNGDPRLRRHVHNARRAPNRWGVSLSKEHRESARKIDLAVCAVGARKARQDVLSVGAVAKPKHQPGRVFSFS